MVLGSERNLKIDSALGYGSGAILFGAGASSAEMNLGDFEPLHHLSLKAAMCFQAAMLAAISEKADAIRAVHVLTGINNKSPETLEGFDLGSVGIELKYNSNRMAGSRRSLMWHDWL